MRRCFDKLLFEALWGSQHWGRLELWTPAICRVWRSSRGKLRCIALACLLADCAAPQVPWQDTSALPPEVVRGAHSPNARTPWLSPAGACVVGAPETCGNGLDDDCNHLVDEGCGRLGGAGQFVLAWEEPSTDLELLVTGPDGQLAQVGRLTESGLTKQRDCPGENNGCKGVNLENVVADGVPPAGRYQVEVIVAAMGGAMPPIRATLSVRLGEQQVQLEAYFHRIRERQTWTFEL